MRPVETKKIENGEDIIKEEIKNRLAKDIKKFRGRNQDVSIDYLGAMCLMAKKEILEMLDSLIEDGLPICVQDDCVYYVNEWSDVYSSMERIDKEIHRLQKRKSLIFNNCSYELRGVKSNDNL